MIFIIKDIQSYDEENAYNKRLFNVEKDSNSHSNLKCLSEG
ncbi:MAG: hypothetical protein ACI905_001854 [Roseivirga sp.]|jgi:hypothetical protein